MRASSTNYYSYDAVSRLQTDSVNFVSGVVNSTTTFGYNPANQITSQARTNDSYSYSSYAPGTKSYAVNGLNQYIAVNAGGLGYDSNGNLASNGGTTFTYDVENRLVSAAGSMTAELRYDPLGRLWQTSGASGTTQFLYDRDALINTYDGVTGAFEDRYVYGPGEDEPIMWVAGNTVDCVGMSFLHPDHQGSIVARADCWGNPIAIKTYDEYGVPSGGDVGRFQYTGQAWLPDLGMYYYKARIYSSGLGRFLQTDPVGYDDQNNLYAYVGNDPVNGRDPSGKQCLDPTAAPCSPDDHTNLGRVAQVAWGTAEVVLGSVGMLGGAAGDIGSGGLTLATGGAAAPITIPAAAVSTAVVIGGAALAADGYKNITGAILNNSSSNKGDGQSGGGDHDYKSPTSGSGKEKASDAPSWAKSNPTARPRIGETPNESATRVLDTKYGSGNYAKGPGSEFSKIQKWHSRGFK